ncbi:Lrp/AsnC family transcriptional regulator [Sulfitobacter sp. HNIBRBA3233]|uniref:Lrp/AsnC family transcriptional regulator n=1 Tax=Sulfitobacter marinivivus TaxID=3158558 RepID=UPI0032DFC480
MDEFLDWTDHAILRLLLADSSLSKAELAERTGLSASSCWRRVRALEQSGVIERYTVALDHARMGLAFEAIVHLHLDRHDSGGVKRLSDALRARAEVVACFATTGAADYHMHVRCADIAAYNRFLEDVLFSNTSVRSAQTNVVLKRIKSGSVF